MISGNHKEFVGSNLCKSWQEVAEDKPGEGGRDKVVKSYQA